MDRFPDLDMERMKWSSGSSPNKGPRRLCRFCAFGIFLPILFLCVPLYMRFQALKPHMFTLSPSDMKLLNHESRVSTVWCQGQELKMNASFNAYLLKERPRLLRYRHHVTMNRKMILPDDIKEYWGFYLLKGSLVKLSVCSRHEGASFIIVKGLKDARRCSYLGELDSQEESDEISDEFEFSHEIHEIPQGVVVNDTKNVVTMKAPPISREINSYIDQVGGWSDRSKQVLVKRLLEALGEDPRSEENLVTNARRFEAYQVQGIQTPVDQDEVTNFVKPSRVVRDTDYDVNNGGEDLTNPDIVYDLLDQGRFDQQDKAKVDGSNEEVRSSWSSSEEALAACEGLIYNVPLNGGLMCHEGARHEDLKTAMTEVTLEVEDTGFYYFIFANENEIMDNFLYASFDMRKTTFDVSANVQNCTNATTCQLPLTFWSEDHVVLEIPEEEVDPCDALVGYSSLDECHQVIMAESICKPRKPIYMALILTVPVLILTFAYV